MQMHGLHTSNPELLVHIPHYTVPTLDIKSLDCCHGLRVMSYYEIAEGRFLIRNKLWDRCTTFLRATHAFLREYLERLANHQQETSRYRAVSICPT